TTNNNHQQNSSNKGNEHGQNGAHNKSRLGSRFWMCLSIVLALLLAGRYPLQQLQLSVWGDSPLTSTSTSFSSVSQSQDSNQVEMDPAAKPRDIRFFNDKKEEVHLFWGKDGAETLMAKLKPFEGVQYTTYLVLHF